METMNNFMKLECLSTGIVIQSSRYQILIKVGNIISLVVVNWEPWSAVVVMFVNLVIKYGSWSTWDLDQLVYGYWSRGIYSAGIMIIWGHDLLNGLVLIGLSI